MQLKNQIRMNQFRIKLKNKSLKEMHQIKRKIFNLYKANYQLE
jgi:hypothetical protein